MSKSQPWERQPSDTTKSFEAFQAYRDMGKERSLRELARQLGKSNTIVGQWSVKHDWKRRIESWEAEQDRIKRADLMKGIGAMRQRHAKIAESMLEKAAKALQQIPDDEIKASDISKMIDVASKLERISRGDVGEVVEERDGGTAVDPVQFYIPSNGRDQE